MIKSFSIKNFGPVQSLSCEGLAGVNLFIGPNGIGKSIILKSLYAALKSVEQSGHGMEHRSVKELLSSKLYWTFQTDELGMLVRKGTQELSFTMSSDKGETVSYSFGYATSKKITNLSSTFAKREDNTVFIPAKEVLSLKDNIEESRSDKYNAFGFDDTYFDLVRALRPQTRGKNYKKFADARTCMMDAIGGKVEYDPKRQRWTFASKNAGILPISLTSEGVKKLSIIDVLLGNHYLTPNSVVIIDEPESALHPRLVSTFMEIICELSKAGIQFFMASHSYFVIKKLYVLAHQKKMSVPVISLGCDHAVQCDLKEGMPQNQIMEESVKLYTEEMQK